MRAIKTRSWFETALDYKPWILDTNIEKLPFLVHEYIVCNTNRSEKWGEKYTNRGL